jgi:hypothetical protein
MIVYAIRDGRRRLLEYAKPSPPRTPLAGPSPGLSDLPWIAMCTATPSDIAQLGGGLDMGERGFPTQQWEVGQVGVTDG